VYEYTASKYTISSIYPKLADVCKISRAAGPGSLHDHRGQTDVTADLQGCDVFEGSDAVPVRVYLHPIDHNPEGMTLTTDGYRERLSPAEGHPSVTLLSAPLRLLLGVSHHNVLVETWIIM